MSEACERLRARASRSALPMNSLRALSAQNPNRHCMALHYGLQLCQYQAASLHIEGIGLAELRAHMPCASLDPFSKTGTAPPAWAHQTGEVFLFAKGSHLLEMFVLSIRPGRILFCVKLLETSSCAASRVTRSTHDRSGEVSFPKCFTQGPCKRELPKSLPRNTALQALA